MVKSVNIKQFLKRAKQSPVIDVRSPKEFENGHIPGAVNIPLFNNMERAKVGTTYKQSGREQAILLGLEIAAPKMTGFVKKVERIAHSAEREHGAEHMANGAERMSESMDDNKEPGIVSTKNFSQSNWLEKLKKVSIPFFIALTIFGIGYGIALFLKETFGIYDVNPENPEKTEIKLIILILTITTLGIAASFNNSIRRLKGSFESGEYLMLIFCLAVASLANFSDIIKAGPFLLSYVGVVIVGAILIHYLLAAIFRIDADTVIITSTAGIYGAPFIAPISNILKNRDILVAGLTTSLIGYAFGNYLGIGVAKLLAFLLN